MDIMHIQPHKSSLVDLLEWLKTSADNSLYDKKTSKLKPLLKIVLEKSGHEQLNACNQLRQWLADPECSLEEFSYTLSVLGQNYLDCETPITRDVLKGLDHVAQALAMRRPVLEGQWELMAWIVARFIPVHDYNFGTDTGVINKWVVEMMGDPQICPSPPLRFEFLDIFTVIGHNAIPHSNVNLKQAFASFISACTTLGIDQSGESLFENDPVELFQPIKSVVDIFFEDEQGELLSTLDQHLSAKLLSQISSIIKDVSCSYGLYPNANKGSHEVDFVTSLFKVTSNCAKYLQRMDTMDHNNYYYLVELLETLLTSFKKSCQTPQLVDVTTTCIIDVLQTILLVYMHLLVDGRGQEAFNGNAIRTLNKILGQLIDTPVIQVMTCKYQESLTKLMGQLYAVDFDSRINELFASWEMAVGFAQKILWILLQV